MLLAEILGYLYATIKSWALSIIFIKNSARMLLRLTMNLFMGLRNLRSSTHSASQLRDVAPHEFPTTGFTIIPASETVEEENWPWYVPQSFYPVRIGDVLHSMYQVLYKANSVTEPPTLETRCRLTKNSPSLGKRAFPSVTCVYVSHASGRVGKWKKKWESASVWGNHRFHTVPARAPSLSQPPSCVLCRLVW